MIKKSKFLIGLMACIALQGVKAGNEDRTGEAGGQQLLINPWARTSALGGANTAYIRGVEALFTNVAGLAFTRKTEILFNHTRYLVSSGININSFALGQRLSETSTLGLSVVSFDFGDIPITTVQLPEGGSGFFRPSYMNINVAYAKEFSNSIYGGINVKMLSEQISNVRSQGFAFDAGIRYVTGEYDRIKFGISLKNIGPPMKFFGDGLAFRNTNINTGVSSTEEHRSAQFELPSLLNIGASYDFFINPTIDSLNDEISSDHKIIASVNFTSNSFTRDQYRIGLEYSLKNMFYLRTGYVFERKAQNSPENIMSAHWGPSFGLGFYRPINKNGSTIGIDYSYMFSNPFMGTHTIGVRIDL